MQREPIKSLFELIKEFHKVLGYEIHTGKSVAFVFTNNTVDEKELNKTSAIYNSQKKLNT